MPEERRLLVNKQGPVMVVTFNRPPRNFFDEPMSIELDRITRSLRRDPTTRVVVFTGTDDVYLTHFDVPSLRSGAASFPVPVGAAGGRALGVLARAAVANQRIDARLRSTPTRELLFLGRTYAALKRLNDLDQIVITEINGLALGMGAIFALACDLRLMADDSEIGITESGLALLAGAGGTLNLTRTVGTHTAIELLLEGRWFSAAEARDMRLVHHVGPRHELHAHTMRIADRLASRSPTVTREIKRAVYHSSTYPRRRALAREAAGMIRTLTSREAPPLLETYERHLTATQPLTDDAILRGWHRLLHVPEQRDSQRSAAKHHQESRMAR